MARGQRKGSKKRGSRKGSRKGSRRVPRGKSKILHRGGATNDITTWTAKETADGEFTVTHSADVYAENYLVIDDRGAANKYRTLTLTEQKLVAEADAVGPGATVDPVATPGETDFKVTKAASTANVTAGNDVLDTYEFSKEPTATAAANAAAAGDGGTATAALAAKATAGTFTLVKLP